MSRKTIKGKNAVYLCTVPSDFRPQRVWDVPKSILSANLHYKKLSMMAALDFARVHNLPQINELMHNHRPIENWAMVMRNLKPEWNPLPVYNPKRAEKSDGSEADEDILQGIGENEFLSEEEQIRQGEILDRITDLLGQLGDLYTQLDYYTKTNRSRKNDTPPQSGQNKGIVSESAGVGQEGGAE